MWLRAPMTGMRENRNPDVSRKENKNSTSEEQVQRPPLYAYKECIHTCTEE